MESELDGDKIEYTMNSRGGLYLLYEGYLFAREKNQGKKVYWACKDRRAYKCGARLSQLTEVNKIIIVNRSHNHPVITREFFCNSFLEIQK